MDQRQAEAEASKRERHKRPGLGAKQWTAVENDDGTWRVALVDDHAQLQREALVDARAAFHSGNLSALMEAASRALMAGVRAQLDEPVVRPPSTLHGIRKG